MSELACISILSGLCCLLPVTLRTLLQLYRSIVSAFIACWFPKSPQSTQHLRERDTMTVCVSPDRSSLSEEQSVAAQYLSLLCCAHKSCENWYEIKRRDAWAVPEMIEWSAKIWWAPAAAIFQERASFQYLTSSLEEDNDGRGSSSHKSSTVGT